MRGDIIKIVVCGSVIVSVSLTSVTVCADETKVDIPLMQPTPAPVLGISPYNFDEIRLENAVKAAQAAGALIPDIEDRIAKLTQASNELDTLLSNPANTSPNSQIINKAAVDTKALIAAEIENLTKLSTDAKTYAGVSYTVTPYIKTGTLSNNTDPGDFQRASERLKSIMTNAIQNANTLINSSTMITTSPSTSNINITKATDTTRTYFNGEINTSVNATTANTVGAISTGKTTAVITGLGSGTVNATDTGAGDVPSSVIAVGNNTFANVNNGSSAIIIGDNAQVYGYLDTELLETAIAIGGNAKVSGDDSLAFGFNAQATDKHTTAIGNNAKATSVNATAFGRNAEAGNNDTAIGGDSLATGGASTATGGGSKATSFGSTATGVTAQATGLKSTATGAASKATGENSVALGAESVADQDNQVSIGQKITDAATGAVSYVTRTLSNLTDGTDAHDAVNKGQLDTAKADAVSEANT
ncbi:hypothetical protein S726_005349, partial [Salmonella enterica subsp. enterica]|nr:hypothetical protein [Salmonella enterica subsp. enterica]